MELTEATEQILLDKIETKADLNVDLKIDFKMTDCKSNVEKLLQLIYR